jgi:hypothetical protein
MQTARQIAVVLLTGGLIAAPAAHLKAEDPAATDELPAAIQALGVSGSDVVTETEAKRVRGRFYVSEGVIVQFAGVGAYPKSALAVSGVMGGREVTFVADVDGIRIETHKIAYVSGPPRVQGVVATQTGTFNGVMEFRGGPASLEIIALPGSFLANFE